MLFWLVMHMNETMFKTIEDKSTRSAIQGLSFFELLIEVGVLIVFITIFILNTIERKR